MALIEWDDLFSVGVTALDEEHKKLIAILNDLYEVMNAGRSKDKVEDLLARLSQYCGGHLTHEESLFAKTNYPDAAAHKGEHDYFRKQVVEFQAKCHADMSSADAVDLINMIRNWLVHHILNVDQKYTTYMNANGIK